VPIQTEKPAGASLFGVAGVAEREWRLQFVVLNVLDLLTDFVGQLLELHEALPGARAGRLIAFLIELHEVLFGVLQKVSQLAIAFVERAHACTFAN
jgi:hypothetical protein